MNLALSLLQPWAWLVMYADKSVENRSWSPPPSLVGRRLWIHASKGGSSAYLRETLACLVRDGLISVAPEIDDLPRGVIVGSVRLVEVIQPRSSRSDVLLGNPWYSPGSVAWMLADPIPLTKPVVATGMQKLWKVSDETMRKIASA